jgi:hypothetical protein
VAVDGKAVRGTRHASSDGQAVHLLAAADQQAGAVLAQAAVDGKTSEITRFAPLLEPVPPGNSIVSLTCPFRLRGWCGDGGWPGADEDRLPVHALVIRPGCPGGPR